MRLFSDHKSNAPRLLFVAALLLTGAAAAQNDTPPANVPTPAASTASPRPATAEDGKIVANSPLGVCIHRPPPYPATALRNDQQGRTVLSFEVSAGGVAGQAAVLRSSQHSVLDAAALHHLQQCIASSAKVTEGTLPPGRYVLPWEWRIQ
jgi:TonB family protein